jgi:hypothetical protein
MAYSIYKAKGSQQIARANAQLQKQFNDAAGLVEGATTEAGKFFNECISKVDREDAVDTMVVFCAASELGSGVSLNADTLSNSGLILYSLVSPSGVSGDSVHMELLGTSHDDLPNPGWASQSVMLVRPTSFLAPAVGSALDDIVTQLLSTEHANKKQKGENSSNIKSSGDDIKWVIDMDGVAHPSSNSKRDSDRFRPWTSLMRVASETHRVMYMGNYGIPEYKEAEIIVRLESERSLSTSRAEDYPLKGLASIETITHLEAVKNEAKFFMALSFNFQRISPLQLCLADFYDGTRLEVFPPSTTALCDMLAMERVSRMFLGLERFLTIFCGQEYKGTFTNLRDRLTVPGFPGRRHSFAFMMDWLQAPIFAATARLREARDTSGSLRGPSNVRALLEREFENLVFPSFSGKCQTSEFDYLSSTYTRIRWSPIVSASAVIAQSSALPQGQPGLSTTQLKKMVKQSKLASGSNAAGGNHVTSSTQSATVTTNICLRDVARLLGVQGQLCKPPAGQVCRFTHAPLKTISKAGALAAIDKIKNPPSGLDLTDLRTKVTTSTTMPV